MTTMFGAEAAYKYVNGVLDKAARGLEGVDGVSRRATAFQYRTFVRY